MAEPVLQDDNRLSLARTLVSEIESGNEEEVSRLVAEISRQHETSLFTEIGKLTRELHDSLRSVEIDGRLEELTSNEIPDAKERLNYVIEYTENAANRTLNAVEECMPLVSQLTADTKGISDQWSRLKRREMDVDEFRKLSESMIQYLGRTEQNSAELQKQLNEVLMAQDFQDITGQVIKKVLELVHNVEEGLVDMIKLSGGYATEQRSQSKGTGIEPEGPQIGAVDNGNVVNGQDDVDDLLSSLGF